MPRSRASRPVRPIPGHARWRWLLLPLLVAGSATVAAAAVPKADDAFLARQQALLDAAAKRPGASGTEAEGAVAAARAILRLRTEALLELGRAMPLSGVTGIETQDQYDDAVVRALHPIVVRAMKGETEPPPREDAVYYSTLLGEPLPLGSAPVGFMVLQRAVDAVRVADALENDPAISRKSVHRLALRFMQQPLELYMDSHSDDIALATSAAFRQNSFVVRLRCPKDEGNYRISGQKNKMRPGGAVSTLYDLRCNVCYEALELEFPIPILSELDRLSEKQGLKKKALPANPSPGLEP